MILEKVYDELMAQIEDLKKAVAGASKDYDKLDNRPKVNNITLTGNKKSSDLKIAYSMTEAEYAATTKNAESIYCLQENATSFEEEDETASASIEWSAGDPSGYMATWVYAPSNQNFTGCTAVECDDPAIIVDLFSAAEGDVQVFLTCEDTTQIGETVTFTFTLTQPAGRTRIVKNGVEIGANKEIYSEIETVVGEFLGTPLYRKVVSLDSVSDTPQTVASGVGYAFLEHCLIDLGASGKFSPDYISTTNAAGNRQPYLTIVGGDAKIATQSSTAFDMVASIIYTKSN